MVYNNGNRSRGIEKENRQQIIKIETRDMYYFHLNSQTRFHFHVLRLETYTTKGSQHIENTMYSEQHERIRHQSHRKII